jgi:hypothetical protein
VFPPVKENKLEGSIPSPANEGPTTCERPEAAGALEAGVREIETACAIVKHEADSSSELIAMVYGKQEATESNHCSIKFDIERKRGDSRLLKCSSGPATIKIGIGHGLNIDW